jgi:hypothetical protein
VDGVKTCRKCSEAKPHGDFPANSKMRDERSSWCRECHREATRRTRERYREKYNAARRVPAPEPRECLECGKVFTPKRRDGEMCSDLCRERHRHRRTRAWLRQYGFGSCRAPAGRA